MARRVRAGVLAGAAAGLVGTWVMTEFQALWSRLAGDKPESSAGRHDAREWQERNEDQNANELMSQRIAARVLHRRLNEDELAIAATAVHYGFGTGMGMVYGALAAANARRPPVGVSGVVFGTALWIAADEVAVPALHLSKPDAEYPLEVHLQAFAAHLVYGIATELAYRAVIRSMGFDRESQRPEDATAF